MVALPLSRTAIKLFLRAMAADVALDKLPERWRARITLQWWPGVSEELGPCWTMGGWGTGNGYAKVRDKGKCRVAHRAIYERFVCIIPPKHLLDHLCDNRACVRPFHMEPVTVQENTLRGRAILFAKRES